MKKFFWDFEKVKNVLSGFIGCLATFAFTNFCSGDWMGGISDIIFGVLIYLTMRVIETSIKMRTMLLELCEDVRDLLNTCQSVSDKEPEAEQEVEQKGPKSSVENMDEIELGHVAEGVGCDK